MAQFSDLTDDCLRKVFDQLPPGQWFKLLRVDQRLSQLSAEKIRTKIKAISLNESSQFFSSCAHLDSTITRDQVLFLLPTYENECARTLFSSGPYEPPRDVFLSVLTRCASVECIDFGYFKNLSGDLIMEVVKRCPKLGCFKLGKSMVDVAEWDQVLNEIGTKIVHFEKDRFSLNLNDAIETSGIKLFEKIVAKCTNIRQIDWSTSGRLNNKFATALKTLPKTCRVSLSCEAFLGDVVEHVDELSVQKLNWSLLGDRVERLSSLTFHKLKNDVPVRRVIFTNLKKLDFNININKYSQEAVNCVSACRFPQLEEFCFNASAGLTEDDYEKLFLRMARSVKKLTIDWDKPIRDGVAQQLPGATVKMLMKLDTIDLRILVAEKNKQTLDFIHQLEQYIDGISSLEKLTVALSYHRRRAHVEIKKVVENHIKRLMIKQNRVKINWIEKVYD